MNGQNYQSSFQPQYQPQGFQPQAYQGNSYPPYVNPESYFDGGLAQQVGWSIVGFLITVLTLGICYPWAVCLMYRWKARHTVISGRRLAFDGTAVQLFGKWCLWLLLTYITLGIYSFWLHIALTKWITKHTHFA